ncbi:secretory phospholipase A2 receptor-like [Cebidichthys violaceus]|uniref:secretory phospholipase A2 receptor-like n=1 Tax=Cebidichthys violaceus TaxID=271503 RepID=UPI0035C961ED
MNSQTPQSSIMMERIWLGVVFLSGWNISMCLLHQYHYVAEPKTWTEAQLHCRETYKDLATIENIEEVNQLVNTVSSLGYNDDVWIGLFSVIDWRWSNGSSGSGSEYRKWENQADNEPDFASYNQFCVNIGDTGRWWDDNCKLLYPFICYNGQQLDPEFVFVNQRMDWFSAQRYCRENFIDLATVRNDTENQKIQSLLPGGDWAWIGLFRDPHIYWSDGSGYTFSYLTPGSNTIGSMTRLCSYADLRISGKWRLWSCETRLPFVCYSVPPVKTPVMRQVVRLRIKPEDHSLDLNDFAVKADILKKASLQNPP